MDLSIRALRQLVAVAEDGSVSRAAVRLNVAQPWLSSRIRQIEDQWQLRLFERHARGVAVTRQGIDFLRQARRVLAEFDELAGLAGSAGGAERLRIGAAPFTYFLPERSAILDGFGASHPSVSLVVENSIDPLLREALDMGRLDACFVTGTPSLAYEHLLVCENRCELLLPNDHPLAAFDPIPLEQLKNVDIEIFPPDANPVAWETTGARLAAAGARLFHTPEPMRQALLDRARRLGRAAAILGHIPSIDDEMADLSRRRLADSTIRADLHLVRLKASRSRPSLERFWHYAREQLRALAEARKS